MANAPRIRTDHGHFLSQLRADDGQQLAVGGGGSISVTDGTTTVNPATSIGLPAGSVSDGGGGLATVTAPTLAEVLAAGPDVNDVSIVGHPASYAGGASASLLADDAVLQAANGINDGGTEPGGSVRLAGGTESDSGAGPAFVEFSGGGVYGADTGGKARINGGTAKLSSGAIGGDISLAPGAGDGAGRNGLVFLNLPTSDPAVAGALWADTLVVKVSAG